MTVTKVVDASALAALLFDEPEAPEVARQLGDARLIAPMLLDLELASVCWKKQRRSPDQAEALAAAFRLRTRLAIERRPLDADGVLALALDTGLTVYDAAYLWLSRQTGAALVTLDHALGAAAAASPIEP